jgi:TP53 regulating kinase-like protein
VDILLLHPRLIQRGAEADIYLIYWYGKQAISKIRNLKKYRNKHLDDNIRKKRTIHEANMISTVKKIGLRTPFLYFIDPIRAEIIMEYAQGSNVKDILSNSLALEIGRYVSLLHNYNIIHGDLTTSNFIKKDNYLFIIDFGLSYFSERIEDKAVDLRLFKEVLSSAHIDIFKDVYDNFITGYSSNTTNDIKKILQVVSKIEKRGRYT